MVKEIEYLGKWKLPNSDTWFDGSLIFSPEKGISLLIVPTFSYDVFEESYHEIILGKTTNENEHITLVSNYNRGTNRIYHSSFLLIGKHFNNIEEIRFQEVKFRLFNFHEWWGIFEESPDFNDEFSIHENCQGQMNLLNPILQEDNLLKIENDEKIFFKYKKKIPFKEILNDIGTFQGFLTLMTFEQSYPLSIIFGDDDDSTENHKVSQNLNIQCIYQNTFYNRKYKIRESNELLLGLQDIQDDIPKLIWNWYKKNQEINPPFVLLLNYFSEKDDFEKFLSIIKGLESFHKLTIQSKKNLLKRLKDFFRKYPNRSEKKLKWGLKDLIRKYPNQFIWEQIPDVGKFCNEIVRLRNYYSHPDLTFIERSVTGEDIFQGTQKLTGLLISCVLTEIGVKIYLIEDRLNQLLN